MDYELVYDLMPRTSLEETIRAQARHKAEHHLAHVAHHGRLEAQEVSEEELAAQVEELISWLVDRSGLWCERFHHRLAAIHPFPNGNGRYGRIAADYLVMALGQPRFSWRSRLDVDTENLWPCTVTHPDGRREAH